MWLMLMHHIHLEMGSKNGKNRGWSGHHRRVRKVSSVQPLVALGRMEPESRRPPASRSSRRVTEGGAASGGRHRGPSDHSRSQHRMQLRGKNRMLVLLLMMLLRLVVVL